MPVFRELLVRNTNQPVLRVNSRSRYDGTCATQRHAKLRLSLLGFSDSSALEHEDFTMMVAMGFFLSVDQRYRMILPIGVRAARVIHIIHRRFRSELFYTDAEKKVAQSHKRRTPPQAPRPP
jgi:hypothetical protein